MENTPSLMDMVINHMAISMAHDFGRYLVAATLVVVVLKLAKGFAAARKIQNRHAKRTDIIREFSSSLRTAFVFGLTGFSTMAMVELGWVRFAAQNFSWPLLGLQTAIIIIAHDAYFYWMHRALHHRKLFRATHLHHHKSRTPTPWAAYSFSVWEAVAEAMFLPPFLLLTSLLGFEYLPAAILIFLTHMILRNAMGHAGVELMPAFWVDSRWSDWITSTTHHDLHHSGGNHNFGLYFTWWDRWMGTEHPRYKETFRTVVSRQRKTFNQQAPSSIS